MTVAEFYTKHQNSGNKISMDKLKAIANYLKWHGKHKYIGLLIDLQETKFITNEEYLDLMILEV